MKTTIPASANQPSTMMPIPMAATYVSASSGAARAMAQDGGQDDEPDDPAAHSVVLGARGAVHRAPPAEQGQQRDPAHHATSPRHHASSARSASDRRCRNDPAVDQVADDAVRHGPVL